MTDARLYTDSVFSNMENNEMNNTDTLEKIIRPKKQRPRISLSGTFVDAALYRTNKRMQDNISEFLGAYGINTQHIWFSPHYSQRRTIVFHLRDKPETSVYQN